MSKEEMLRRAQERMGIDQGDRGVNIVNSRRVYVWRMIIKYLEGIQYSVDDKKLREYILSLKANTGHKIIDNPTNAEVQKALKLYKL